MLGFVGRLWIAIVALEVLGHEGDLLCQHVITYRVLDATSCRLRLAHVGEEHLLNDRVECEVKILLVQLLLHLHSFLFVHILKL